MRSRRTFLKMAGLAAVGAALPPLWLAGPRRDPAADWPEGPGIRLGRGAIGWGAPILSRPHPEGKELGHVFPDDVVRIMREVVGLGMAYHTHVWFELEEGFVYSPYLQPVYNLPQTPLTTIPPEGVWTELVTPYVDGRKTASTNAPIVYRIYYSAVFRVTEVVAGDDGQPWYKVEMEDGYALYAPAKVFRLIQA